MKVMTGQTTEEELAGQLTYIHIKKSDVTCYLWCPTGSMSGLNLQLQCYFLVPAFRPEIMIHSFMLLFHPHFKKRF